MQKRNAHPRSSKKSGVPASRRALAPLCLAALTLCASAGAQGNTASLNGEVKDSSGAKIPGAQLTLRNTATKSVIRIHSNGSGVFNFSNLQSGDYALTVEKDTFRAFVEDGIHLDPGDTRTVSDIALSVGSASDVVEVTTSSNGLSLDSGEVSSTISAGDIENLAVEGRDVTELLKTLPGMAISNGAQYTVSENRPVDPGNVSIGGGLGGYVANGTLKNGTALLVDGADITDPGSWGAAIQNVNYDMVGEVKVSTGSFGADTARGPVVVSAVTKSGTDRFHGSLYTYARTYQLNSTDSLVAAYGQTKPTDRQIYPGFTIGGPVRLPFTDWNHSNRLTFFLGAEEYAQRNTYAYGNVNNALVRALVPTANMRKGLFNQAELKAYLGDQYTTSVVSGVQTCTGAYVSLCPVPSIGRDGSAIVNGDISRFLDPLSSTILNLFPLPNQPSVGGFNYIAGNYVNNNLWQTRSRFDYSISDRQKLFFSYGYETGKAYPVQTASGFSSGPLGGLPFPGGGQVTDLQSHVASLGLNSVFTSSLTNEFYVAAAYLSQITSPKNPAAMQGNPYQFLFPNPGTALPALTDSGRNGLPNLPIQDTYYGATYSNKQIRSVGDNLTKLQGRHIFRTGVFYQWADNPQYSNGFYTNGSFSSAIYTSSFQDPLAGTVHTAGSGAGITTGQNYLADFAEGILGSFSQANKQIKSNLYFWNLSGYIQDHFRATSRLSLDFGVRFEHFTPWQDVGGVGIAVFDAKSYAAGFPNASPGVVYHGVNASIPNAGVPAKAVYVEPRGGFAWDMRGNAGTVLRGGAGLYRQHDSFSDLINAANAARGQRTINTPGNNGGLLFSTLHAYQGTASNASNAFVKDTTVRVVDATDDKVPTVLTYNLMLDQSLNRQSVFEVAYVGSSSTNLLNNQQSGYLSNINAIPLGGLFGPMPNTRPDALTGSVQPGYLFPYFAPSGQTALTNISTAQIDAYRKYPLYSSIYAQKHVLSANYNSLQTRFRYNTTRASINVNYTWGKALGNYWGTDPTNYDNGYFPLLSDRRHIFNTTFSYKVGNVAHGRLTGALLNGWTTSGIIGIQSGVFLPTIYSYNYSATTALTVNVPKGSTATINGRTSTCTSATCSVGPSSARLLGTPDIMFLLRYTGSPKGKAANQYIDGSVMRLPNLQQNGPYKVPETRGPGFFNADLNAGKNFNMGEKRTLILRVSAFNFLNRANPTFSSLNPANYTLNYTYTAPSPADLSYVLDQPTNTQAQFGSTRLANGDVQKAGRRVMEISVKYAF